MKVAVVGAGPAGSTLALRLAEKGIDVEVFEALPRPRGLCGGGLGATMIRWMKRFNPYVEEAARHAALHWVQRARIVIGRHGVPVGAVEAHSSDFDGEPLGVIMDRSEFDYYLARKAESAGAVIHWNTRVSPSELREKYDIVVDAGGFTSWGRSDRPPDVVVLEQHWIRDSRGAVELIYDTSIRKGYIWVFPAGELTKVGFGEDPEYYQDPQHRSEIRLLTARYAGLPGYEELLEAAARSDYAALPLYAPRRARYYRRGVFYVGTAAGLVDPLTGAGIKYAVASGAMLADSISPRLPKRVIASRYVANVASRITPELAMLRVLRNKILRLARANPEGALELAKLVKVYAVKKGSPDARTLARLVIKLLA